MRKKSNRVRNWRQLFRKENLENGFSVFLIRPTILNFTRVLPVALILLVLLFFHSAAAWGELPSYITDQLHRNIRYEIITERNLKVIKKYKPGSRPVHFVVIQVAPKNFTGEQAKSLMEWVESGGILWFYDSRLAEHFGMKNSPYEKKKIKGEPYKGGYGVGKADGLNVVASALPFVEHEVATGVRNIQVFLMEVGENKYSAVSSETPGVIPIFAANIEKKSVVALNKVGKGWVIFKPLLWPEILGGARFQVNLKEFSAGYPVPKAEKPVIPRKAYKGKPVKLKRYDSLILSDGNQYIGMVMEKKFTFMGGEGKIEKKVDQIKSISITEIGDRIVLRNDETHTGTLMILNIYLKTTTGRKVKIEKENIQSIDFDVGQK